MTVKHNLLNTMDEFPENQNEISDEELELELELDGDEDTVVTDKKDKVIKSLLARTRKAEAIARKLKTQPRINKQEEVKDFFDDERFDLITEGYSKDQVRFIQSNGGRKALEDPNSLVSIAIKAQKEQRRAEQAANAIDDSSGLSEVERKFTNEQLAEMSQEELEKHLPHAE